jgi:plasmid stabilization system protein ParE
MHNIAFHPKVKWDAEAAYTWYELQAQGLGDSFLTELESAYRAIAQAPLSWPGFGTDTRRFILDRFPFSIIYSMTEDGVLILSVMHQSRKPGYWQERIK